MTYEDVQRAALALPDVQTGTSYGTPALKVGKALLARLRDEDVLVLFADFDEREFLMQADPEAFFITDHHRAYPMLLARLSRVEAGTVARLVTQRWRQVAPRKMVAAFDQASGARP